LLKTAQPTSDVVARGLRSFGFLSKHWPAGLSSSLAVCLLRSWAESTGSSLATTPVTTTLARVVSNTVQMPLVDGRDIRFTHLSNAQVLSQVRLSQIIQDDQGFLWFGAQRGLKRYDGYRFKVFTSDPTHRDSGRRIRLFAFERSLVDLRWSR
jgi:hypothetical protein